MKPIATRALHFRHKRTEGSWRRLEEADGEKPTTAETQATTQRIPDSHRRAAHLLLVTHKKEQNKTKQHSLFEDGDSGDTLSRFSLIQAQVIRTQIVLL